MINGLFQVFIRRGGTIFEYFVKKSHESVWIKKEGSVVLANEGRRYVVIVYLKWDYISTRLWKPFKVISSRIKQSGE